MNKKPGSDETEHAKTEVSQARPQEQTQAPTNQLIEQISSLIARVERLESMAHTDHTLSADGVQQISDHVMGRAAEHIRKTLGHSGEPVRG